MNVPSGTSTLSAGQGRPLGGQVFKWNPKEGCTGVARWHAREEPWRPELQRELRSPQSPRRKRTWDAVRKVGSHKPNSWDAVLFKVQWVEWHDLAQVSKKITLAKEPPPMPKGSRCPRSQETRSEKYQPGELRSWSSVPSVLDFCDERCFRTFCWESWA